MQCIICTLKSPFKHEKLQKMFDIAEILIIEILRILRNFPCLMTSSQVARRALMSPAASIILVYNANTSGISSHTFFFILKAQFMKSQGPSCR